MIYVHTSVHNAQRNTTCVAPVTHVSKDSTTSTVTTASIRASGHTSVKFVGEHSAVRLRYPDTSRDLRVVLDGGPTLASDDLEASRVLLQRLDSQAAMTVSL